MRRGCLFPAPALGLLSTYVGAPPRDRKVASRQQISVASVRSRHGITMRKRDHASHAL
jgi:hypothetical protein